MQKTKKTTESTQTWLNVWEKWANERKFNPKLEEYKQEDLDKKLQMFYAEVRTKEGFFYNFVENNFIINKKSYDRSCISWYMVACDINFLRFSNCTGPQLMQFWELWKDHLCHITKHTSIYTLSYILNMILGGIYCCYCCCFIFWIFKNKNKGVLQQI